MPLLVFEGFHKFDLDLSVTLELVESNEYWWVSLLSLLRLVMLVRIYQTLVMLCTMLSETYFSHRITIENAKNIGINILTAILILHFSASLWLIVHREAKYAETMHILIEQVKKRVLTQGYENDLMRNLIESSEVEFLNSIYFMTTTMTTVGFGDNKGMNESERIFLSIIMFFGLAMFTIIVNQVMSIRKVLKVEDLVAASNDNIIDYIYNLSKRRNTISLHGEIYQASMQAIEENLRYSTKETFKSEFWRTLTPQIQNKIVNQCLFMQAHKLRFYFNDFENHIAAP